MPTENKITEKANAAPEKTAQPWTEDQRIQATRVLNTMPFMGGIGMQFPNGGQTSESIVRNLELMRAALRVAALRLDEAENEASQLRRERLTIRSFLGLDTGERFRVAFEGGRAVSITKPTEKLATAARNAIDAMENMKQGKFRGAVAALREALESEGQ